MRLFLTLIFICSIGIASAQDSSVVFKVKRPSESENSSIYNQKVFQVVEQMPQYQGGDDAMMDFIKNNLNYPDSFQAQHIGGRVVVGFVVI
jgi:protein TonB